MPQKNLAFTASHALTPRLMEILFSGGLTNWVRNEGHVESDGSFLSLHQHEPRVLQQLLDVHQELNRLTPIHNAMVITEGYIHHGADHNLTI